MLFLILGMFTVGSSSYMIAGLVPKISETIAQPIAVTSQGITAFGLTYLLSAPFFSVVLANRPAKRMLQAALVIFTIGNLLTLLSQDIALFLLGRIVTGLGAGIFNPLCVAIVIQLSEHATKGRILSIVWGANSAGVVFGVPLGIYLAAKFNWQMAITSLASLGLYSHVALIAVPQALMATLFAWGLGGFIGSSIVGRCVDYTKNPRAVMAVVLIGLTVAIATIPFTKDLPYVALLSFFMWGLFGWAMPLPQQHVLFELGNNQTAILAALNSSAIGLGSALGTVLGGLVITLGFKQTNLPFLATIVLTGVVTAQILLIKKFQLRGSALNGRVSGTN